MQKVYIIALVVLVLVVGFVFVSNVDTNKEEIPKDTTFIYCGDYGFVSQELFMNSEYCKNLYGIK